MAESPAAKPTRPTTTTPKAKKAGGRTPTKASKTTPAQIGRKRARSPSSAAGKSTRSTHPARSSPSKRKRSDDGGDDSIVDGGEVPKRQRVELEGEEEEKEKEEEEVARGPVAATPRRSSIGGIVSGIVSTPVSIVKSIASFLSPSSTTAKITDEHAESEKDKVLREGKHSQPSNPPPPKRHTLSQPIPPPPEYERSREAWLPALERLAELTGLADPNPLTECT